MVAKINVGSSLFGALAYNQKKIVEGEGRVLCSNKMAESLDGGFDMHRCMVDFERQLPDDIKTEKPIIHISLNPHPDDRLSDEQLAAIAQEYLEKLGYGNQPYIVYKHEDIERHHIHIVSLRVDDAGKKINDSFEHQRSKTITRELEHKYGLRPAEKQQRSQAYLSKKVIPQEGNVKGQIANLIKSLSIRYHFQSFNEYRALLSLYNICVEETKGEVRRRVYNGLVYFATDDNGNKTGNPFKSSLFGKSVGYKAIHERCERSKETIKEKGFREQTKKTVATIIREKGTRSEFESELKRKGIDVIFRTNDSGRIYGVTFIDHNTECVFNGSRLGKEFSANVFQEQFSAPHPDGNKQQQQNPERSPNLAHTTSENHKESETVLESALDLFIMESHGNDPEEEAFIRRMRRKKKKKLKL